MLCFVNGQDAVIIFLKFLNHIYFVILFEIYRHRRLIEFNPESKLELSYFQVNTFHQKNMQFLIKAIFFSIFLPETQNHLGPYVSETYHQWWQSTELE